MVEDIKIVIDDKLKNIAKEHSKERMKFEYNRFGFCSQKRENMILIGTIGQLVFKQFLESMNISFKYQLQAGNYDDFDFEINNEIFEIKTSMFYGDYSKLNLLYSQDQYVSGKRKNFKYCVQIFVNGMNSSTRMLDIEKTDIAFISGYIEFDNIKLFKNKKQYYGDDYKVPIKQLKNILDLLIKK